jgi:hypothetical protein
MTLLEMLQADGLSAEEISTLTSNPKYAASLEKMRTQAEEGTTALLNAQKLKQDIEDFNNKTVIPYGAKKDQETAAALAEVAKHKTYLKSLKDSGYDIPDAYLEAAPAPNPTPNTPPPPSGVSSADLENYGKSYMSLMSMSERARDLLGHGLDVEAEYEDFGKNKRPAERLRDYIDRKYDLTSKQKAKDEATKSAEVKRLKDEAIEEYKLANPRSASDDLAPPAASKFDKFKSLPEDRRNSHTTEAGREAATIARQEKYAKFLVQ